jgi:hypothetical protein
VVKLWDVPAPPWPGRAPAGPRPVPR